MTTRVIVFSLCVGLMHTTSSARQKADLSGDWVLNAEKSDFGPIPPPKCVGRKIAQKGAEFVIELPEVTGAPVGARPRPVPAQATAVPVSAS